MILNILATAVHVLLCVSLIGIVLLQAGRGAGIGAGFGGSSQTVFGGRGAAPFLIKFTAGIAFAFMGTSGVLAYLSTSRHSVVKDALKQEAKQAEAAKEEAATAPDTGTPRSAGAADAGTSTTTTTTPTTPTTTNTSTTTTPNPSGK